MTMRRVLVVRLSTFVMTIALITSGGGPVADALQVQPQKFQAGVDLITIDVQISPASDAPLRDFSVSDFDIRISGRKRPAVSATRLHYDEGKVSRNAPRPGSGTSSACVFGFFRATNRTTAHYTIGVESIDADRREVKDVVVKVADKLFAAERYVWRSPIRRTAAKPLR